MAFKLDLEELPKSGITKLYKFKSFDQDGYYKDLLNNQLWLSSRTELNDPNDCRVPYDFELCTEEQIKQKMFDLLSDRYPAFIKIKMVERQCAHRKSNPDLYQRYYNEFIDYRIGVVSLTIDFNDYMWENYADKHKGFCIELDAMKLYELFDQRFQTTGRRVFIFKVRYVNELPVVNPCIASLDEKSQLFLVKTMKWKNENEWRAVCFEKNKELEPIDSGIIKNIYFGLNASKENIDTAIKILSTSNPGIGIFKALKKKDEFGLDFEKIA